MYSVIKNKKRGNKKCVHFAVNGFQNEEVITPTSKQTAAVRDRTVDSLLDELDR